MPGLKPQVHFCYNIHTMKTSRNIDRKRGRRKAGSWGRATGPLKRVANRATRQHAKLVLRYATA